NNLLMQNIADVLDAPVERPYVAETTALGAAYAAGLAVGFWDDLDTLRANWHRAAEWTPKMTADTRERERRNWLKAVERTMGWIDQDERPEL
ncbi:FGGY-family carbohydrate kinase, partial [Kitasatospora cineracea]